MAFHSTLARHLVFPLLYRRAGIDPARFGERFRYLESAPIAEVERYQIDQLTDLLDQCGRREHADAARRYGLTALPVTERADLAADPGAVQKYSLGNRVLSSSGSTGVPVTIVQSRRYFGRMIARRWNTLDWYGLSEGALEARLWGRPGRSSRSDLRHLLAGRKQFDLRIDEPAEIERGMRRMERWRPDYVYGYTSLIIKLARSVAAARLRALGVRVVIATAETMDEEQRATISGIFGCPVAMEYGCTEADIMAVMCPQHRMHVLADHVILEVVDATGRPVPAGTEGEILVTDLDHTLTPVVRYRVGDRGTMASEPCRCGRTLPVLADISGRESNRFIVLSNGRTIHASDLNGIFKQLHGRGFVFTRFEGVQTEPGKLVVFVAEAPESSHDEIAATIGNALDALSAGQLDVAIQFHDRLRPQGTKMQSFRSELTGP